MVLEQGSSLLQIILNSSLHEHVRTVPAKIKYFNGPGVRTSTFADEFKQFPYENVRTVSAKIEDFDGPGVRKPTFAN